MRWQIGDIKVTSVYEQPLAGIDELIPEASRDVVRSIPWLAPNYADAKGNMLGVIQAFILQTPSHKIVIDTCVGNDKNLALVERWHMQQHAFMERFSESGHSPEQIDVVLCTHMHLDHVGWNTWLDDGQWKPTFPNARYLFARVEYDEFMKLVSAETANPGDAKDQEEVVRAMFGIINRATYAESILPVIEAGLADFVTTTHQVCNGVRLIPTHGHTPGHVSILLTSRSSEAVITGDVIHHPVQIAKPDLWTIADASRGDAIQTRKEILKRAERAGLLLIGTHFSEPAAGYIKKDNGEYVFADSPGR